MRSCILLGVAVAAPAHAHGPDVVDDSNGIADREPRFERRDLFALGIGSVTRWTATEGLNAELQSAGYDPVTPLSQQLSFVIRAALQHVRFGFDIGGEVGMRRAVRRSDGAALDVNEFLGSVDFGYEVYTDPSFTLFPQAGFAFGATDVSLPAQTSFSFEQPNRTPPPDRSLRQSATALRLGFVIEHPIVRTLHDSYDGRDAYGLLLSLGAGYLLPLDTSNWELVEEREERNLSIDLTSGPTVPLAGPYIQVAIGLAAFAGHFTPVQQ